MTSFSLRPNYREATQLHPSTENWIKDLLNTRFIDQSKTQIPQQPVPLIRKLSPTSYPHPSESRHNENHNHRKLTKVVTWITALSNSIKLWAMSCRAIQDRLWWRALTQCSPRDKGMANHFSIHALRTPWTVLKGKKDMAQKDEFSRSVGTHYATGEE